MEISRLWIGMLTRNADNAGTNSKIVLSINVGGTDVMDHTFSENTYQKDQERGEANVYELDLQGKGIEAGSARRRQPCGQYPPPACSEMQSAASTDGLAVCRARQPVAAPSTRPLPRGIRRVRFCRCSRVPVLECGQQERSILAVCWT